MKITNNFITNSSSTCYILKRNVSFEKLQEIVKNNAKPYESLFVELVEFMKEEYLPLDLCYDAADMAHQFILKPFVDFVNYYEPNTLKVYDEDDIYTIDEEVRDEIFYDISYNKFSNEFHSRFNLPEY